MRPVPPAQKCSVKGTVFEGGAPGDYELYAWEELPADFGDPAFLASLKTKGESVHVTKGSRLSVDLHLIASDKSVE
jgi:hypothetical protein